MTDEERKLVKTIHSQNSTSLGLTLGGELSWADLAFLFDLADRCDKAEAELDAARGIYQDGECVWCGKKTCRYAGGTGDLPFWFPWHDEPGVVKVHCGRCVLGRLHERDELKAELDRVSCFLAGHRFPGYEFVPKSGPPSEEDLAARAGYERDACPWCSRFRLVRSGSCWVCDACGKRGEG